MSKPGVVHETFGLKAPSDVNPEQRTAVDRHDHHDAEDSNDHLALIYEDHDDQFAAVVPFIRQGLKRGERCLYVADDNTPTEILNELRASDIDVDTAVESGDLVIWAAEETYLKTGSFDRDAMLDFWEESLVEARDNQGYTGVRAAAEMTWALDSETGLDQLARYEAMLNSLYSGDDYVVLCQYNRNRFPVDVLSDVIYTHPVIVYDETTCRNTQYCPPDEFLSSHQPSLEIGQMISRLLGHGTREDEPPTNISDGGRAVSRILPLIADQGNRRVVSEWLDSQYDVIPIEEAARALREGTVDLCMLDAANFDQHRDVLIDAKTAQEPCILPYLLFREEDRAIVDSDAQQYIDDVIVTPTTKQELEWRLNSLLRLREKSLQLNQTNEQLEYLVGAAAHDLRNPLQIAQGYVKQLDESDPVVHITNALNRMSHLVENLLSVQRTQQDVTDEDLESVLFTSLVEECWEVIPTEDANITVVDAEAVEIQAVPNLVKQLMENLLSNAIEHGGDDVMIRVGTLTDPDGFYVADDGPGIPVENRLPVFEEGFSTSEGNGLGLAIVKRVCDMHEWQVRIGESASGGAKFEISNVEINGGKDE